MQNLIANLKKSFTERHLYFCLLLLICLAVAFLNFDSTKWLTGWDTLHPEFNFGFHFFRSLFGVWREDQGLGTIAAHSHMSDLPRIIILWFLNVALPLKNVKYVYDLLCLILGPIGVYFFSYKLFEKNKKSAGAASFLASLVYLFNLGTVQHFYVVFEMFAVQYAALGWLFLLAYQYLKTKKLSQLALFAFISFLASPMAYASLLWFAFAGSLGLFLLTFSLLEKSKEYFLRSFIIGITIVAVNAFWLLPNLYFILTGRSSIPNQSQINQIFSQEAFLHNQAYGQIKDVALVKNFLFNWLEHTPRGFHQLLGVWQNHLQYTDVLIIGYTIFIITVIGFGLALYNRQKNVISLFPIYLLGFFMLTNQNFPFTQLFLFLRNSLTIFEEGFRFPFTKFSLIFMFSGSVFFGYFFAEILSLMKNKLQKGIQILLVLIFATALMRYGWPMFQGNLISPKMKNEIPAAYFDFFEWTDAQPDQTRFAIMPLETQSGWHYLSWNYEGPGFWWFGIKQPALTRDFDRWSEYNETFYNQLSTAVYNQDKQLLSNTFDKYDVSYVLLDESIILPDKNRDLLYLDQIKEMLIEIGATEVFSKDFLHVYQVTKTLNSSFIGTPEKISYLQDVPLKTKTDTIFKNFGNYLENNSDSLLFPFESFSKIEPENLQFSDQELKYEFTPTANDKTFNLVLPSYEIDEIKYFPAFIKYNDQKITIQLKQDISIFLDNQEHILPTLSDLSIDATQLSDDVILDINGEQLQVLNNSEFISAIPLIIGQDTIISIFDADNIYEEDNQLFIDDADILTTTIKKDVWEPYLNREAIITKLGTLRLVYKNPFSLHLQIDQKPFNCDQDKRGTANVETTETGVTQYSVDNFATSCSSITDLKLSKKITYILNIVGANIEGRSIKIYLTNTSNNRADLEKLLPQAEFNSNFVITPWENQLDTGFSLNWDTRSFGQKSTNQLANISITSLPVDYLQDIYLKPMDSDYQIVNNLQVENLHKFGTYQYTLMANNVSDKSSIFYLTQGYDSAWIALQIPENKWHFKEYKLLTHLRYNGWANAWEVPAGQHQIVVIYWPQLLSFAGFGLLLITTLVFALLGVKRLFVKK